MLSQNAVKLLSEARRGRTDEIRALLESDSMLSVVVDLALDGKGRTALHLACSFGHVETTRLLLSTNASTDIVNGRSALHHACAYGSAECARLLLGAGASVDTGDTEGCTALHDACTEGQFQCALLLLEAGASVDIADQLGVTALTAAGVGGCAEVVQLLLRWRANAQGHDGNGMPLFGAVHKGRTSVAALLLEAQADADTRVRVLARRSASADFSAGVFGCEGCSPRAGGRAPPRGGVLPPEALQCCCCCSARMLSPCRARVPAHR